MRIITKIITTSLLLCLFSSIISIYASESEQPITITAVKNNIPFSFTLPDGSSTGLYIEFWELWSRTNNIPINIQVTSFENAITAVKNNNAVHAGLFINESRSEWASFSIPIHSVKTGILYNRQYVSTKNLAELTGKKIATQSGSFQSTYMTEKYPEIIVIDYDNTDEIVKSLLDNGVQAIVGEVPYLNSILAKYGLNGVLHISNETLMQNKVHATIAKGNTELLNRINQGIENIPINELVALEKKWLPRLETFFKESSLVTTLTAAERKWLSQNNSFSLGIDSQLPPFEFRNSENKYSGITAEYVSYINKQLNITLKPITTPSWNDALEGLIAGEVDVISAITDNEQRRTQMSFTLPYFDIPSVIVSSQNGYYVDSLMALDGKILGLVTGYAINESIAKDFPGIIIKNVTSVEDGLKKLQSGKIDAFVDSIAVINYEINKNKIDNVIITAFTSYNRQLSMAVRKGLEPLIPILNKTLATMDENQRTAIANNWLAVRVQKGTDLKTILLWFFPIFTFLMIIILIIIRVNRRMTGEINDRKKAEKLLEDARDAAEFANKSKDDFLANMSHEIRTPMNAVIGMAHLLEETGLSQEQQKYIDILNASSSSLLMLINDILDLSKIEAGKLKLEMKPFLIKKLVSNIASQVDLHIDSTKVVFKQIFDKNIPEILSGDSLRLGQILLNIINNASKFTQHGKIELNLSLVKETNKNLTMQISISDTGIGMSETQIERLFQTYSQADSSTSRKYGGTGLGLSICKHLTALMDGSIWVESKLDEGSTFFITVVLEKANRYDPEVIKLQNSLVDNQLQSKNVSSNDSYDQYPQLIGKSVLIVDDNNVNVILTKKILKKAGLNVCSAVNGEDCLQKIDNVNVDAILMDIQMPVMDGYTATLHLRNNPDHINLPIIALSANVMKTDIDKSFKVGMNAHLAKPLNVDVLLKTLAEHIN